MRAERIRLSYHNADRKEKLNFATSRADFLGSLQQSWRALIFRVLEESLARFFICGD